MAHATRYVTRGNAQEANDSESAQATHERAKGRDMLHPTILQAASKTSMPERVVPRNFE